MTDQTNTQDLISQGNALAKSGQADAAIAAWRLAAAQGNVNGFYNIGLIYFRLAFAAADDGRQAAYLASATKALLPIAAPHFCLPNASLLLGLMAEQVANKVLHASDLEQETRLTGVHNGFCKAVTYFKRTASMHDLLGDGAPAQAMLKLADYNRHGIGGFEVDEAAAQDWEERAAAAMPAKPIPPQHPSFLSGKKPKPRRDFN